MKKQTVTDLNGDGFICARHVGNGGNNHVHIHRRFKVGILLQGLSK